MAQPKAKKKNNKRSIIVSVLCACIILGLVVSIAKKYVDIKKYENRKEEYSVIHSNIEKENQELESINSEDNELEIAEKYAREDGYVMPDEQVYVDITPGN